MLLIVVVITTWLHCVNFKQLMILFFGQFDVDQMMGGRFAKCTFIVIKIGF